MEILGVGLPELAFIILIALIVMGPRDMEKTARTIGTTLRKIVKSDAWQAMRSTSNVVSRAPNQWMREAGFDDDDLDIAARGRKDLSARALIGDPAARFGSWSGAPGLDDGPGDGSDANGSAPSEPVQDGDVHA